TYSLRDELDAAWAVRPLALTKQDGGTTLVLEDPGGETLDRFLPGPMEMTQFLRFAIRLATALGGLHKRELIHKDVKPANVLVNPATGQVRLMGFGIASRLPRERQASESPEFISGTLSYMAPEQTGRMNYTLSQHERTCTLGFFTFNASRQKMTLEIIPEAAMSLKSKLRGPLARVVANLLIGVVGLVIVRLIAQYLPMF